MSSTIVGQAGREYIQGEVLQRHPKDPNLNIYQACSEGRSFVLKRVSESFFNLSQRLKSEFAGTRRLRMHNHPDFPPAEIKKILRLTGEALQELHAKDWIHIDVKPDNILVNWTCDDEGNQEVTDAVLGDFDIAFKLEGVTALRTRYAIGNVMWRSPEGQTGKGVTKASDIFSFGLVCIYALGGGELLLIGDWKEVEKLAKHGITPEQEIVIRHFLYFGPCLGGLLDLVNDETWTVALKQAFNVAERAAKDQPLYRFEQWGEDFGPEVKKMISGMTDLDPAARSTIDEVLKHEWW